MKLTSYILRLTGNLQGRRIQILAGLLAGLIFTATFYSVLNRIPSEFYWLRDDAVITMSHARNLADFGTIGVDPSGNRVEGFSSPAIFWIYYLSYKLLGMSPQLFTWIYVVAATFLIGFCLSLFMPVRSTADLIFSMFLSLLAAAALSCIYPFLGWHASGMENALTHLLLLATLYVLYSFVQSGRVRYSTALLVALASMTRIEGVLFVGPLLIIFAIYWLIFEKRWAGVWFGLVVTGIWCTYQLWRYTYFGSLFPNTVAAQRIDVVARIQGLLRQDRDLWQSSWQLTRQYLGGLGGGLFVLVIPLIFLSKRRSEHWVLLVLCSLLVLFTLAHPFVFYATRLDPLRYATHLPLVIVCLISCFAFSAGRNLLRLSITMVTLGLAVPLIAYSSIKPYALCCYVDKLPSWTATIDSVAQKLQLPRPTVALPDLGMISWQKKYNIVDLGFLGSPIMAHLQTNTDALIDYFLAFAAPDFFESHGWWSCLYNDLLESERFLDMYAPISKLEVDLWSRENCPRNPESPSGIWVRQELKDASSREMALIKKLAGGLSLEPLRQELPICGRFPEIHSCQYVTRTAYRFMPEFKKAGIYNQVIALFSDTKTAAFDQAFLQGSEVGNWYVAATQYLLQQSSKQARQRRFFDLDNLIARSKLITKGKLDAYLRKNEVILISTQCSESLDRLFLHIVPEKLEDLPESARSLGYDIYDLAARRRLTRSRNVCLVRIRLPYYPVQGFFYGEQAGQGTGSGWSIWAEVPGALGSVMK